MANKIKYLSQIQQGSTVQSWHVSQSVDAFTGASDYEISISGSLNLTSSLSISSSNLLTTSQPQVLTYNPTTGQVFRANTSSLPDTTYTIDATDDGDNAKINISGSNDVNSFIKLIPGSNVTIDVLGDEITIDATAGINGSSGSSGTSGVNGSSGSSGTSGGVGGSGSSGSSGVSGSSGSSGTSGATGTSGDLYKTTSTTAFTLGGAGSLTVATGLAYSTAQSIIIVNDLTHFQECEVSSYNSATGVLVVTTPTRTVGTGSFSSWTINLDGATGGDGSSGSSGTSGDTGSSGSSGTSGEDGSSGSSGIAGSSGSSGVSGSSGSSGTSGDSGSSGSSGDSGSSGSSGDSGSSGSSGADGSSGSSGTSGDSGSSGSSGTSGFLALTGNTVSSLITNDGDSTGTVEANLRFLSGTKLSVTGSVEVSGVLLDGDGDAGTTGQVLSSTGSQLNWIDAASGASGSSGSSGTSGNSGSSGSSGTSGSSGAAGSSGSSGVSGSSGSSGVSGSSGSSGDSGSSGSSGDSGSSGSSGDSGSSGSSGAAGSSGSSGAAGSSGTSGSSGSSGTGSIQSIATGNGITGGTITTTGTIAVDYSTGSDNLIFSAPAVTSVTTGKPYAPYINVAESNPGVSYDIVERIRLSDIRLDMWDEPTGDVNLSYEKIINLASPTISTDAANKTYVDANDLVSSFTNGADNRLITATSTTGINGEANLIFNSSSNSLTISAGGLHVGSGITPTTVGIGQFTNDVIAYYSSDRRLKENITPIPNALDKVMAINGVTFDWIPLSDEQRKTLHPNEGHDIGIIAQEIEAVLPEVVTTRETGFKAVKYEKIVALLIEAIKEQQTQIDELKRKI